MLTRRDLARKIFAAGTSAGMLLTQVRAWAQGPDGGAPAGGGRGGGRGGGGRGGGGRGGGRGGAESTVGTSSATDTEWRHYANDLASTRYSPLDQINASNFNKLEVAWRFNTDNLGVGAEVDNQCTPLVIKGRIFGTAGQKRDAFALDAVTGEQLWLHRYDESPRRGARTGSGHGVSYWTDGTNERVFYVTPGYLLIALDAKTGIRDPGFGKDGILDLREDDDQTMDLNTGDVSLHATPLVVKNVIVVGAAHADGHVPTERNNVKGYTRGFDVKTGKRLWIFHTIPRKGEFGYDTWITEGQPELTGNTGVWAEMSADEELGLVYIGVELPTGDYVGIYRRGPALFGESLVALDVQTGKRKWHYQMVHHGLWDRDVPCAGVLCDIPVNGKIVKAIAQPTKQCFLYVLNRETGEPIWPIPEMPVPQGNAPGEWYSPTQPIPSKPPAYDMQGVSNDDLVDFTPAIKARAVEIASHYQMGPLYTPPMAVDPKGLWGALVTPGVQGGSNWPGASYDPETHLIYMYTKRQLMVLNVGPNPNTSSDFEMVSVGGGGGGGGRGGGAASLEGPIAQGTSTVAGLPLLKPPYGAITAIDLSKGEIAWRIAHGETPDNIRNHPLLKGLNIPRTGSIGILGTLSTKSLVICGDAVTYTDEKGRMGARLRAYDKLTGEEKGAVFMAGQQTGTPMTYMRGGRQYVLLSTRIPTGGTDFVAFRLPGAD